MLDHLSIQCQDIAAALRFYDTVFATIGGKRVLDFGDVVGYGVETPDFWVGAQTTGGANREVHLAFTAPSRAAVDTFFAAARGVGAEVLHEPRVWPEYHADYYGAFV